MTNPVEEYLSNNKNVKLSIKSLSKRLDMKKKQVYYYTTKSDHIRKIDPLEVGSLKTVINVFEYY